MGLLAPHPVAFKKSADIIPHTARTEPYVITDRGVRLHLRLLEHNPPTELHIHFAILQCRYTNKLGTAIAIPISQTSASNVSGSEDDFFRSINQDFIEVTYSQTTILDNQSVYFLTAGPLFLSNASETFHRCWLRD